MRKELISTLLTARTHGFHSVSDQTLTELHQLDLLDGKEFTQRASKLMDATVWWRDRQNIKHLTNCLGGNYILIQDDTVVDYARYVETLASRHANSTVTVIWVPQPDA